MGKRSSRVIPSPWSRPPVLRTIFSTWSNLPLRILPSPRWSGGTGTATLAAMAILFASSAGADLGSHDQPPSTDRFEAPDTVTFAGQVLDPDGYPVAGAVVYAHNGQSGQVWGGSTYPIPWRLFVPDPLANSNPGQPQVRGRTKTGEDGRFSVAGIEVPVEGYVRVVHPSYVAIKVLADPDSLHDLTVDFGTISLQRGAAVEAIVLTADGYPVADVWVGTRPAVREEPEAEYPSIPWPTPGDLRVARTDATGQCRLQGLKGGRYVVAAFTDRNPPGEKIIQVAAGGTAEVSFTLRQGHTMRVEVLDRASLAPRVGARVDVYLPDERTEEGYHVRHMPRPPAVRRGRTGEDGVAEVCGLEDREYAVTVIPEDHADARLSYNPPFSVTVETRPGETVRVLLDPVVCQEVVAVHAATGALLPGLHVRLGGVTASFDAAADRHLLEGLRPGSRRLLAFVPDYLPIQRKEVFVPPTGLGKPLRLEFAPATERLSGRVLSYGTGTPIAGARITSQESTSLGDGQQASAVTDAEGRYEIGPLLGKGFDLKLSVEAQGYLPENLYVEDNEDRPDPIPAFRLVRPGRIRGILRDAGGHPVAYSRLGLLVKVGNKDQGKGGTGNPVYRFVQKAVAGAAGAFVFEDVKPGSYLIRDIAAGSYSARWDPLRVEKIVELAEGACVEVDLEFQ